MCLRSQPPWRSSCCPSWCSSWRRLPALPCTGCRLQAPVCCRTCTTASSNGATVWWQPWAGKHMVPRSLLLTLPSLALPAESATRCWMKALGCAVLRAALAVLPVRAQLVAHALRLLGEEHGAVLGLDCGAQELEQELVLVQGLLAQHGLGSAPQQSPAPAEQGEAHGDG